MTEELQAPNPKPRTVNLEPCTVRLSELETTFSLREKVPEGRKGHFICLNANDSPPATPKALDV
jgi:hypothetical protein